MKPTRIVLTPTRSRALNIFLGLLMLMLAVLWLLALATYNPADPSLDTSTGAVAAPQIHNWIGLAGAWMSDLLLQVIGITAFLPVFWLGGLGWNWMRSRPGGSIVLRWIGVALALAFVPVCLALLPWHWLWRSSLPIEGVSGKLFSGWMVGYLNVQGTALVAGTLAFAGLYLASSALVAALREWAAERWLSLQMAYDRWSLWRERRAESNALRMAEQEARGSRYRPAQVRGYDSGTLPAAAAAEPAEQLQPIRPVKPKVAPEPEPDDERPSLWQRLFHRKPRAVETDLIDDVPAYERAALDLNEEAPAPKKSIWETTAPAAAASAAAAALPLQEAPVAPVAITQRVAARTEAQIAPQQVTSPAPPLPPQMAPKAQLAPPQVVAINERADADLHTTTVAPKNMSGFKLPPSTLLTRSDAPLAIREDQLRQEAKILEEKCGEFDVRGKVVQINPGPMVTTYEFKPEAGVKYSRVTGLADDLCLAMRAESILIERMAGKSTVGIQVPNHEKETIFLRDVIESETFIKSKSRLTIAMGKDINGRIVTADLASMPHVLIAGSTGSGKSVAINAMIMSLLFRTTPNQVRFILVDPKRVELGMYDGVPHLFTPIITEPKLAANALRNAVREMERRYKVLAARSVRTIDQYNKLFEGSTMSLFDDNTGQEEEPLPYIVIIIDELADLMMLDRANVEESITRLAQMARAVGIHLILATQRPSVDVITGLIKANVPTRISFRLASKVDSRTIIDTNGAEALLGRGDMLFLPPGTSRLNRLHAPFVSEKETAAVVGFWKAQGEAEYVEGFLDSPREEKAPGEGGASDGDDNDPLFDDAVRLVFEFGKASTSLIQRRLRVGYGRAAHLIDLMERDGLVGPADGSKARELLKSPGWLHEVPNLDE